MFGKVKLNVKLNRHLSSVEDYDELQNIMGSYSFCKSKHSGKIFLIVTKFKKTTIFYIGNALIVPIWIGLFMLIPISKWICLLLGCVIAFISICGMSISRKKFIKKLQFHPLMVFDPQKQIISFYHQKQIEKQMEKHSDENLPYVEAFVNLNKLSSNELKELESILNINSK